MRSRVLCKTTAWLMTAVLLVTTLLSAMPLTALAAGDSVSLSLGAVSGLAGETVLVPLSVQSTAGIANVDATITYNASVLTPVQQSDGEWVDWNSSALGSNAFCTSAVTATGTLKIVYAGTSNTQANTALLWIPFKVSSSAASGSYAVSMQVGDLQVYDAVYGDDFGAYSPTVYTYSGSVSVRSDTGAVTFKVVPQSSSVNGGATVAVDVMLESTTGLSNFGLSVYFDSTKLTPVQQADEEWVVWNYSVMDTPSSSRYFASNYKTGEGCIYLAYVAKKTTTSASGKIATIYFTANSLTSAATVTLTPSNTDAQYYAPNHGEADEYGYVSPTIRLTSGSVLVLATTTTTTTKTTITTTTTKATTTTTTTKATTTTTTKASTTTTTKKTTTTTTTTTTKLDVREVVTLSVGSATGTVGDIVQVPVIISANHYVRNGSIDIVYDASVLQAQMVSNGTYIDGINTAVLPGGSGTVSLMSNGRLHLTLTSSASGGGTTSGAIVLLNFKILSYKEETPISLTVNSLESNNGYSNGDYDTTYVVQSGTVSQTTPVTTKTTTGTHPTAATPVTFSVVSTTDVVHTGQIVAMDIVLDSKLGVSNFSMTLEFDADALTPIACGGDAWVEWNTDAVGTDPLKIFTADNYTAGSHSLYLSYVASKKNTAAQCVIATVYFKVNDSLGNRPSATVTVTPSSSDVQYYDTVNGNKYGYVTPTVTTMNKETITVYQPLTIEYYSDTDMVHTMTIANTSSSVTIPEIGVTPKKLNYSFIEWAIKSQAATLVRVEAIYGYVIEVSGGQLTSSYVAAAGHWLIDGTKAYFNTPSNNGGILGYDSRAQVVAPATSGTQVFSHWADQYGNIVSYDTTYTFFVPGNLTLTAVYAASAPTKTPTAAMQIVRGQYGTDDTGTKGTITWVCAFNRGDTSAYTVTEWGIIYGPGENYNDLLSDDEKKALKMAASEYSEDSNQYSYSINKVGVDKTRSAVAYVTYKDKATGATHTVYSSNLLTMTMSQTL